VTPTLHRRIGFEIELMAPAGLSRRTLADELATRHRGTVQPVWHHDSEPSLVPGLGRFLHLTQGFRVLRADGTELCTLVDDITLTDGLDPRKPPAPGGWYRVLTDDGRLLTLLSAHCDPGAPIETVLEAPAKLWSAPLDTIGDVYRLDDPGDATIAMAAPLGGERERPCEIVTPPIADNHHARLAELLGPSRDLGFTVPHEAAVHLHVDGGPFRKPHTLANLIRLFAHWRDPLRTLLQTNPACRRLAPLPQALVTAADRTPTEGTMARAAKGTPEAVWSALADAADESELTKFYDVNLTQLFRARPIRDTVEIRILPGDIDPDPLLHRAALVDLLLDLCESPDPLPSPAPTTDPETRVDLLLHLAAETLARQA
jgi:hypothetical protein